MIFQLLSQCVQFLYGDTKELSQVERWALKNSNRCSADDIIAAAIVQSIAKDFDSWTGGLTLSRPRGATSDPPPSVSLRRNSPDILIKRDWIKGRSRDRDGIHPWYWHPADSVSVNGIPLDHSNSYLIIRAHEQIQRRTQMAKEAAERAKGNMERNEKAWNLAESLLGMKRNEFGALVPVKTVEMEDVK